MEDIFRLSASMIFSWRTGEAPPQHPHPHPHHPQPHDHQRRVLVPARGWPSCCRSCPRSQPRHGGPSSPWRRLVQFRKHCLDMTEPDQAVRPGQRWHCQAWWAAMRSRWRPLSTSCAPSSSPSPPSFTLSSSRHVTETLVKDKHPFLFSGDLEMWISQRYQTDDISLHIKSYQTPILQQESIIHRIDLITLWHLRGGSQKKYLCLTKTNSSAIILKWFHFKYSFQIVQKQKICLLLWNPSKSPYCQYQD